MKIFKKLIVLLFLLVLYLYVANITLMPKNIIIMQGENLSVSTLWGVNIKQIATTNPRRNRPRQTVWYNRLRCKYFRYNTT